MEWYYAVNDERRGPVSEAEFVRLTAAGEVRPETLVWREGMATWQPWGELPKETPSPAAMCSECGAMFAENELIEIEGRRVCAACKPTVLQRVREGVEAGTAERDVEVRLLTPREVLALSWSVWLRNFGLILALTLISAIPINLILEAADPGVEATLREVGRQIRLAVLLQLLLGSVSVLGIAFVVAETIAGRAVTFGGALKFASTRWLAAIGTGFIENIIIGFLLILLIVPGIIWLGYYTFSVYVVALRQLSGKAALDYSKGLVRGRWWWVVGFVFALMVITTLPMVIIEMSVPTESTAASVISSTITDVLMTFLTVAIGVMFLNLDALKQAGRL